MKLHQFQPHQLARCYDGMFQSVFGWLQEHRAGDFVLVATDDESKKMLGFVSCLEHHGKEIHIQFGGLGADGKGYRALGILKRICSRLASMGYKWITMIVENTNSPMLRLALKEGFKIHGVRVATDQTIYVEMIKEE